MVPFRDNQGEVSVIVRQDGKAVVGLVLLKSSHVEGGLGVAVDCPACAANEQAV